MHFNYVNTYMTDKNIDVILKLKASTKKQTYI